MNSTQLLFNEFESQLYFRNWKIDFTILVYCMSSDYETFLLSTSTKVNGTVFSCTLRNYSAMCKICEMSKKVALKPEIQTH